MQDSLYWKLKDNSLSDNDEQYLMSTLILTGTQRDYKRGDPIFLWPFFNSYKWLLFELFLIIFFKGIILKPFMIRRDARPQTSFLFLCWFSLGLLWKRVRHWAWTLHRAKTAILYLRTPIYSLCNYHWLNTKRVQNLKRKKKIEKIIKLLVLTMCLTYPES